MQQKSAVQVWIASLQYEGAKYTARCIDICIYIYMHMYIGPIKTWEERSVEEMNGRNVVKRRQSELEINRKSNRQRTQRRGRRKQHNHKQRVLFNDRTGEIFPVYSGPFTHGPTSPPIAYPVIEKAGVFVLRFLVGCLLLLFPVFFGPFTHGQKVISHCIPSH